MQQMQQIDPPFIGSVLGALAFGLLLGVLLGRHSVLADAQAILSDAAQLRAAASQAVARAEVFHRQANRMARATEAAQRGSAIPVEHLTSLLIPEADGPSLPRAYRRKPLVRCPKCGNAIVEVPHGRRCSSRACRWFEITGDGGPVAEIPTVDSDRVAREALDVHPLSVPLSASGWEPEPGPSPEPPSSSFECSPEPSCGGGHDFA